jgi:hypothetical protein
MRQAIFVVLIVAAAFLGGALANGPGVRWVRTRLLDYLGLKEGEIVSINLPGTAPETADSRDSKSSLPPVEPATRAPSVATNVQSENPGTPGSPIAGSGTGSARSSSTQAQSKSTTRAAKQGQTQVGASARETASESASSAKPNAGNVLGSLLGLTGKAKSQQNGHSTGSGRKGDDSEVALIPLPTPTAVPEPEAPEPSDAGYDPKPVSSGGKAPDLVRRTGSSSGVANSAAQESGHPPAPLDPSVGPAILASLSPLSSAQTSTNNRSKADRMFLETAPSPSSPAAPPTEAGSGPLAPSRVAAGDWGALRQKLHSLGVTRYTIEGEPGGRVVFSCLIPLAGRRAVSQRFEAEGDDEFQAAQAAIRRILLWRATRQAPAPAQ